MRLPIRQSLVLSLVLLATASGAATSSGVVIPAGTRISVRMNRTLASNTVKAGDIFSASLSGPIVLNGQTLFPSGAVVTGRVVSTHSGAQTQSGLELALTSVSYQGNSATLRVSPLALSANADQNPAIRVQASSSASNGKLLGTAVLEGREASAGTFVSASAGPGNLVIPAESTLTFVTVHDSPSNVLLASSVADSPETRALMQISRARPGGGEALEEADQQNYDERYLLSRRDRLIIRSCLNGHSQPLPGAISSAAAHVAVNDTLSPDMQGQLQLLPRACEAQLPQLPEAWLRARYGSRILLLDPSSKVMDLFALETDEDP